MRLLLKLIVITFTTFLVGTWGAWVLAEAPESTGANPVAAAKHDDESRKYFTDMELVTQDGEKVRFYTDVLKDKVVLINFVFTNCEDTCPMLTHKLTLVRDMLGDELGNPIYFVSLSIDPDRDTVQALKKFSERLEADHDGWVFLTGKPEYVKHIIQKLGQYTDDIEAHTTLMLAGNVKKRHWMKIPPTVPPRGIVQKLRLLMEEEQG